MADDRRWIILRGIDARADGRAAEIDLAQQVGKFLQAVEVLADRDGKGPEFRAQPHRHRIHQLRAPDLDDVVEFDGLLEKRRLQRSLAVEQRRAIAQDGEAHRRGINVIGGLREIDMVIGIDAGVVAARVCRCGAAPCWQ